ncbi:MAG: ABC transporter [Candidatus Hecatellales archaeon]|nr:MAG: ABC transporter [Candidatus Hecatellales archaeon]
MAEAVSLKDVWVRYDGEPVLEAVSLKVEEKDFLAILGPNGGGKTTLLKVILGLVKPEKGEVKVFNMPPVKARRFIGYLPQRSQFNPEIPLRVLDVVLMGRAGVRGLLKGYKREDVEEALEALSLLGMEQLKDRFFRELSGGEQQKVLIARALASNPKMLLLDEPTVSVDAEGQAKFYEFLKDLSGKLTVILVTHDVTAIYPFVDKIACLNRRLYFHDSKEEAAKEILKAYQCPVEMLAHGLPHRVLQEHGEKGGREA